MKAKTKTAKAKPIVPKRGRGRPTSKRGAGSPAIYVRVSADEWKKLTRFCESANMTPAEVVRFRLGDVFGTMAEAA
jgi:hypothetical protein